MLFNSFSFIIFFAAVLLIYYLLPHRFRWIFLLIASCAFYMAFNPALVVLLLVSCALNHIAAGALDNTADKKNRRRVLGAALSINFGLLFIFKYLTFINGAFIGLFDACGIAYRVPEFDILLPMGISFYTFQAAGYVIDVYRGHIKREKNIFRFMLFITFFPQLVAGPIERAEKLLPQLFAKHKLDMQNIVDGGKYMILGFFRKVVVADRAAAIVNMIYNSPRRYTGLPLVIATLMFAVQIYSDFCGYSEIALGCAKMLGIEIAENFKAPYISKNLREFWSRWHVTLSAWFRDYLYIPLGGSRVKKPRAYANLVLTFAVSGIWHGANWTFLIWGFLHGVLQAIGRLTGPVRRRMLRFLHAETFVLTRICQTALCFVIISVTWVFFRANTVSDAFYILSRMFAGVSFSRQYIYDTITGLGLNLFETAVLFGTIFILCAIECFSARANIHVKLLQKPLAVRFAFYYALAAVILLFGVYNDAGAFIYFQF